MGNALKNNSSLRIWSLIFGYHPDFGGAAIQAHRMYKKLVEEDVTINVLTTSNRNARGLRGQTENHEGVNVYYLSGTQLHSGRTSKIVRIASDLLGLFRLNLLAAKKLLISGKKNEVLCLYGPTIFAFIPVICALIRRMHVVVLPTLMGLDDASYLKSKYGVFAHVAMLSYYRASLIINYSTAQTESCLKAGITPHKVLQIPCGVDTSSYAPPTSEQKIRIREKLGLHSEKKHIIFVGAAIERKGIDILINAFIQLRRKMIDTELLIVGPSDYSSEGFDRPEAQKLLDDLRALLDRHGLADAVHWLGVMDNVQDYMRAADVFCLPTRREGFGIVIAEALAVGLPSVVAKIAGVTTDIISSEREGILVDGYDAGQYAEALERILTSPVLFKEMAAGARRKAEEYFDLNSVTHAHFEAYQMLAHRLNRDEIPTHQLQS